VESGQAHFGGVRDVVDRVVVLEDQNGDLGGGDRVLVQHDAHLGLANAHGVAADEYPSFRIERT